MSGVSIGLMDEFLEYPDGSKLLNRFAVVTYDDLPYPGMVIDIDDIHDGEHTEKTAAVAPDVHIIKKKIIIRDKN